ncbi:CBO0543 family protein [Dendrosporobacter sp. 1207_IL3150]|uniref:CBO0543 family protein n=1 Tax=Dendrosporobacter sp. 1207_IL3150 TaxID=3084054 RepID=UPI002FD8C887
MSLELWLQYIAMTVALLALAFFYKGMKRFIPVAMFASLYANVWCFIAMHFKWWEFPVRVCPIIDDISFTVNMVVVPILAMIWVRYSPMSRVKWALLWSVVLGLMEFFLSRYTHMIVYGNGYDWYYSLLLWLPSWAIWLWFHRWFYKDGWERD